MSKYLFLVVLVALALALFRDDLRARKIAQRSLIYIFLWLSIYRVCFPGLFDVNLGAAMIMVSFWGRFIDVFNIIGLDTGLFLSSEVMLRYALDPLGHGELEGNPFLFLVSSKYLMATLLVSSLFTYQFSLKKHITHLKNVSPRSFYLRRSLLFATLLAIPVMPNFPTMNIYMLLVGLIFTPINESRHI